MRPCLLAASALVLPALAPARAAEPAARGAEPPPLELAWAWTAPGEGIGRRGFEIADVDGDGRDEILAAAGSDYWYQLGLDDGLEQEWTSLPLLEGIQDFVLVRPAPGNYEVLLASNDDLLVYHATSKLQLRSFPAGVGDVTRLAARDLDADGDLEVVVCGGLDLVVLDYATGSSVALAPGLGCTDLALGQTDADPQLEIVLTVEFAGLLLVDSQTFVTQWSDPLLPWSIQLLDADGNGLDEIALGHDEDGVGKLLVVDPRASQTLWQRYWSDPGELTVADVVGDATPEILCGECDPSFPLIALDAPTGSVLLEMQAETDSVDRILVGQLDGDPSLEVAWTSGSTSTAEDVVAALDLTTLQLEGTTPLYHGGFPSLSSSQLPPGMGRQVLVSSRFTSWSDLGTFLLFDPRSGELTRSGQLPPDLWTDYSSVGASRATNFDSDPQQEICLALNDGSSASAVLCLDGLTEEVEWFAELPQDTWIGALEFAELDGEPLPELLVATGGWPPAPYAAVYAVEAENGWLKWRSADLGPSARGTEAHAFLRFGDVDHDGGEEVVAGWVGGALAVLAATSGQLQATSGDVGLEAIDVAQVDADPESDILLADHFGAVSLIDPATGQVESTLLQLSWAIEGLVVSDLSRDGVMDIAVSMGSVIELYDGTDLSLAWTSPYLGYTGNTTALAGADFDGDGLPELAVDFYSGIALFEIPDQLIFADGFESGDTSAWSQAIP